MGLFSKTIIYVDSAIYNLSGDPLDRGNFLRSSVANCILDPNRRDRSIGKSIVANHLRGPAVKQRAFHRWAQNNFSVGCSSAEFVGTGTIGSFDITPYVPVASGYEVVVQTFEIENADFFRWAEQHILATRPDDLLTTWTCSYDQATNQITIQYEDLSTEIITATDYVGSDRYIYVNYIERVPASLPETWVGKIWIYHVGSGVVALDNLDASSNIPPEFFPFIPLRMWNKPIDHADYSDIYADCEEAYKRYTQKSITEILEKIEDNENVGDIDHAFMVFGVPLNTNDNAGRRYIYEFFKELIPYQTWGRAEYETWRTNLLSLDPAYFDVSGNENRIRLKSDHPLAAPYDISVSWSCISEEIFAGVGKVDAKSGEVWLQEGRTTTANQTYIYDYSDSSGEPKYRTRTVEVEELDIYHQVDADTYKVLRISGLVHTNMVYGGRSIEIHPSEALADEDESGFFIPMHGPTLKKLSLVVGTQACVGNALLVLNCYKVVKLKWYQIGFFRILLSIVLAVISAFIFPGAGGILGSHIAVGTSMGFTGIMATIAGSIANTLAAVVLSSVLNAMGGIFEKLGVVFNILLSFVAGQMFSNLFSTGAFSFNFADMFRAENLLRLTSAVGDGIQQYAQTKIEDIQNQLVGLDTWFNEESERIENLTEELLGYSGVLINPLQFTQLNQSGPRAESSDSFLARTLLTGHDIADVSLNVIENFAEISLQLPDYTA